MQHEEAYENGNDMKDTNCALLLVAVFIGAEVANTFICRHDPPGAFGVSDYQLLTHVGHVQIVVFYLVFWGIIRWVNRVKA